MLPLREYTSKQVTLSAESMSTVLQKLHPRYNIHGAFWSNVSLEEIHAAPCRGWTRPQTTDHSKADFHRSLPVTFPIPTILASDTFCGHIYNTNTHVLHVSFILAWNSSIVFTKMNHALKKLYSMRPETPWPGLRLAIFPTWVPGTEVQYF